MKRRLFLALMIFVNGYLFCTQREKPPPINLSDIQREIQKVLKNFDIEEGWIKQVGHGQKRIRVPEDFPLLSLCLELKNSIERVGGSVIKMEEDIKKGRLRVEMGIKGEPIERLIFLIDKNLRRKAKIALIIDDLGYRNDRVVDGFFKLHQNLTFSIIPGLEKSKRIAQRAAEEGREVMIHLPMEPLESRVEDDGFTILTEMSPEKIREVISRAVRQIPNARGVNNHMGSKATLDEGVMQIVMEELKQRNLYFVDSRTNLQSVAFSVAKRTGLPCERNETFIDNPENSQSIEEKLALLAKIARQKGRVVGIAHPYKRTLEVLREEIPRLERKGIQFVPVSEVVR